MSQRFFAAVCAVALLSSIPGLTHAQANAVEDGDARTLFNLGQAAFDQGRFQAAVDYFQQAYDLSHRPQLLYNIGQAADRLRDDRRALTAFESFLREVPVAPQRVSVESRVAVLRAAVAAADARDAETRRLAEAAAAANATPDSSETTSAPDAALRADDSDGGGSSTAGWILAGGGGAALAVGATFLALGLHDKNTVEDVRDGATFASISDEYDRASTRITVGSILLGVGAAAGATGIVLALSAGGSDDEPTALQLRVLPTGFLLRRSF